MLVGLGSSVWQCFLTECAGCNRYVKVGGEPKPRVTWTKEDGKVRLILCPHILIYYLIEICHIGMVGVKNITSMLFIQRCY